MIEAVSRHMVESEACRWQLIEFMLGGQAEWNEKWKEALHAALRVLVDGYIQGSTDPPYAEVFNDAVRAHLQRLRSILDRKGNRFHQGKHRNWARAQIAVEAILPKGGSKYKRLHREFLVKGIATLTIRIQTCRDALWNEDEESAHALVLDLLRGWRTILFDDLLLDEFVSKLNGRKSSRGIAVWMVAQVSKYDEETILKYSRPRKK